MKNIVLMLLVGCGLFENLRALDSFDQAVRYQHNDIGFDAKDFDLDGEDIGERAYHQEGRSINLDDVHDESSSDSDKDVGIQHLRQSKNKFTQLDVVKSILISKKHDVLDDLISIEGLEFSQLTSNEQRVAYLKKSFKDDKVSDDLNYFVIANIAKYFSDGEYTEFIAKIHEIAHKDTSKMITMRDMYKGLVYISIDNGNKATGKQFHLGEGYLYDLLLSSEEFYNKSVNWFYPDAKKAVMYHEASHALVSILKPVDQVVLSLAFEPQGFFRGAAMLAPQQDNHVSKSIMNKSFAHDAKIANAKYVIMMNLAGGVGEQIFHGEKLSFAEFMVSSRYSGIGKRDHIGTDLYKAYQEAEYYCLNKDLNMILDLDEEPVSYVAIASAFGMPASSFYENPDTDSEIMMFIEDCYEETYAILLANKDMLDNVVAAALQEGDFLSGDEIYKIAGKTRPKYKFELTFREKITQVIIDWISWTRKRMAFFEENHPQV